MKTIKIYFDESHKKPFMDYVMQNVRDYSKKDATIIKYCTAEKVTKIVDYFIKKHSTYCNNKGEYYEFGDLHSETPTMIYITATDQTLRRYDDIMNCLQEEIKENYIQFIEEYLYLDIWCEIERLLRLEYQDKLSDWDKRFLNRAYKTT